MAGRLIVACCLGLVALGPAWAQLARQQCDAKQITYGQPDTITTSDHFRRFIKATVDWKTLAAPAATEAGSQLFTSHYGFSGVPVQNNNNFGSGPDDRLQDVLNIQPVIPVRISENWNLITRIITPIYFSADHEHASQSR